MRNSFWWLLGLNLFDAWATLRGLADGTIGEANPLFGRLLALSPSLAGLFKLVAVPLLVFWVASSPAGSWAKQASWLLVGVYAGVALVHLNHLL